MCHQYFAQLFKLLDPILIYNSLLTSYFFAVQLLTYKKFFFLVIRHKPLCRFTDVVYQQEARGLIHIWHTRVLIKVRFEFCYKRDNPKNWKFIFAVIKCVCLSPFSGIQTMVRIFLSTLNRCQYGWRSWSSRVSCLVRKIIKLFLCCD